MTPEEGDEVGEKVAADMAGDESEEAPEAKEAEAEAADEAAEEEEDIPFEEAFEGVDDEEEPSGVDKELAETKERMLRIAADFENFRKRARRDQEEARFRAREDVLKEILPVFDNLERAVAAASDLEEGPAKAIVEGVMMVQKQFETSLDRFGLKPFSSQGEAFDPNFHEAMAGVETDEHPPGTVVQEYQKGYMLGERLLRPSMVVVAKPKAEATPPPEEPAAEEEPEEEGAEPAEGAEGAEGAAAEAEESDSTDEKEKDS